MISPFEGRFIVFEGLDGAGTSTQVGILRDFLSEVGIPVEVTREPTSGPFGAVVRQAIENRVQLDPRALALAFAADRVDHLFNEQNGVVRALRAGRWVVSDRYALSSLAYQAVDVDDIDWLLRINDQAITPDVTVFIDTPTEVCVDRIRQRSFHAELFHDKTRLLQVARNFIRAKREERLVGQLVIVDGSQSVAKVAQAVQVAVSGLVGAASGALEGQSQA